jgi:hypothetical protein
VFGGASGTTGNLVLIDTAGATNAKAWSFTLSSGSLNINTVNDASSGGTTWLSVTRSGIAPALTTITSTGINLSGLATSGLQLNGSAGSSGQVLTSQGASAAPIWSSPALTSLNGTGSVTLDLANTATRAGTASSEPALTFTQASASANQKLSTIRFNSSGTLRWTFNTDANAETNWLTVTRSGATASLITLAGTAITLSAPTTTNSVNVTSSTIPANGIYLSAANTLALSSNTTARMTIDNTGSIATASGTSVDFGARYTELNAAVTATASTTLNCALGNIFTVTMSASITTLAFSNIPASGRAYNMTLILKQDATGGRSITWPASVKWPSATAPTLSGANKTDIVTLLTTDGGTIWYATVGGQNF